MDEPCIEMALNDEYFDDAKEGNKLANQVAVIHMAIKSIPTQIKLEIIKQN